jgi:hypothetical protein
MSNHSHNRDKNKFYYRKKINLIIIFQNYNTNSTTIRD